FSDAKKRQASVQQSAHMGTPLSSLKTIDDFRKRSIYGGDKTRSDLAYAIYALAHNVPETTLREQLASRDLSHKGNHKRQQEYLDRTVLKARIRIREDHTGVSSTTSNGLPESTSGALSART